MSGPEGPGGGRRRGGDERSRDFDLNRDEWFTHPEEPVDDGMWSPEAEKEEGPRKPRRPRRRAPRNDHTEGRSRMFTPPNEPPQQNERPRRRGKIGAGTYTAFGGVAALAFAVGLFSKGPQAPEPPARPPIESTEDTREPATPTAAASEEGPGQIIQRENYEITDARVSARITLPPDIPPNTRVVVSVVFEMMDRQTTERGCQGDTCRSVNRAMQMLDQAFPDLRSLGGVVLGEYTTGEPGSTTVEVPTSIRVGGVDIQLPNGYFVVSDPRPHGNYTRPQIRIEHIAPGVERYAFGIDPTEVQQEQRATQRPQRERVLGTEPAGELEGGPEGR